MKTGHWSYALRYPLFWGFILLMTALKLPSFNRPLSKHHQFNTAVILINAISWQQAGGGAVFCFTPLLNFQGKQNKMAEQGFHIDRQGNHVYLSFGIAWYLVPHVLFTVLHLPPAAATLECFNMAWSVLSAMLLFVWLASLLGSRPRALAGTAVFCFSQGPLWYMGNGYVTTSLMLPWLIMLMAVWQQFAIGPASISRRRLALLLTTGIVLIQHDWSGVFMLVGMCMWSLLRVRKGERDYFRVAFISALACTLGVALVFLPFAAYLGWEQVAGYWLSRFGERSMDAAALSWQGLIRGCLRNLATGYWPVCLFILAAAVTALRIQTAIPSWLGWCLVSLLSCNLVFLNWSALHEFAWMATALAFTVTACFLMHPLPEKSWSRLAGALMLGGLISYFIINPPGRFSMGGDRYDAEKNLGRSIAAKTDSNAVLFCNLRYNKLVEYYALRTFQPAGSPEEATETMKKFGITQAQWVEVDSCMQLLRVMPISP